MDLSGEFRDRADLRARESARRLRDYDDLQNEMSGVETGRQSRFLNASDGPNGANGKKHKAVSERMQEMLDWLLLNDPQYAQVHANLIVVVRDAQQTTQSVQERLTVILSGQRAAMSRLLSAAAKLPDGRIVFRDRHGHIRSENGEIVADDLAATIEWKGSEPHYEDYLALKQRIHDLEEAENELRGIDTELGDIDNAANTNADPLAKQQIGVYTVHTSALKERVQEIQMKIEQSMESPKRDDFSQEIELASTNETVSTAIPSVQLGSKP